ncbi:MAG TPA: sulfite exporter TauE/SafE family protein [bacterium]|nr:sulfite exporter TauE/SafE family protein [bacterium]
MNKITVPIKGMHCRSCELLVEEKLLAIPGVKSVRVNFKKKSADIYFKNQLSSAVIASAVTEAGYAVGLDEKGRWLTQDSAIYRDVAYGGVCLLVLYFLVRALGLFQISVGSSSNPGSLVVVLLIGLTAGVSTCMALVGGLVLGISAKFAEKHPEASAFQKFRPHLFFNLGRISSYFVFGGLIGLAGKAFQLSGPTLGFLTILVGLVMLVVGLQLTELSPKLAGISLTLPSSIGKRLGIKTQHEKEYSHTGALTAGALTFFLPCGFTQAMQLYAMSTGSFMRGALIMAIFAIGTMPGLLGIGGLTAVMKGLFAKRFFKFAGMLVTILAVINISNGLNLTGVTAKIFNISFGSSDGGSATAGKDLPPVVDGYQVVKMTQESGGYSPNSFTVQKDVPVRWIISSVDSNSCAASIYSKAINLRKFLKEGENVVEFTPKETGTIAFSCSMGMYTGKIKVIQGKTSKAEDRSVALEDKVESLNGQAKDSETPGNTTSPVLWEP